jgi:sortilin (neurotensin receptor 3)
VRSEISGRVSQLKLEGKHWYAATASGVYRSIDKGHSWTGGPVLGFKEFVAVDALESDVIAADLYHVVISSDAGNTWNSVKVPQFSGAITQVAIEPNKTYWILTRIGAFRSKDSGNSWEHVMVGQPIANLTSINYDRESKQLLAIGNPRTLVYTSSDGGDTWKQGPQSMWPVHHVAMIHGRLVGLTDFDGVIAEAGSNAGEKNVNAGGGLN